MLANTDKTCNNMIQEKMVTANFDTIHIQATIKGSFVLQNVCAVILAAGDGTRMKSAHPKVLGEVLFKPMITWVTDCCLACGIPTGCAVLGDGADKVTPLLPPQFEAVLQEERLGTGHAASMAQDFLRKGGFSHVLVLGGDVPLLDAQDLRAAYNRHIAEENAVTVVTARVENPFGYGRIIRVGDRVSAIVEERDADDAQRASQEINSGAFWFNTSFLLQFFENMSSHNDQNEYYLTDCVAFATSNGQRVGASIAHPDAALGANSREELQLLNTIARRRILDRLTTSGVNIPLIDGVIIGPDVTVGADTTILPGSILRGKTRVGADCEIGPNSYLDNAEIHDGCTILSSYVLSSQLLEGSRVGPMSNIRPGCTIGPEAKIGDFVEIKNSNIGAETSVAHLTYVGDSDVGERCNFGCGAVTVNYDGTNKYRTTIGDDAFLGCNTNLVAPLTIGDRVYAAAGTTITDDVPDDALVIGRARQLVKERWVQDRGRYTKHQK